MAWMIIGALFLVFAWVFVASLCHVSGRSAELERASKSAPEDAADPTDAAATPAAWARYPVALDDDLQRYIEAVCREYEVEACVVMAVIEVESGCDAGKIGDGGNSYGLMQIYASQHTERCIRLNTYNLLDPKQNVLTGVDYLAELLGAGHGMEWALSWYNGHGGEPCEYAYTVLTEAERLLESVQLVTE